MSMLRVAATKTSQNSPAARVLIAALLLALPGAARAQTAGPSIAINTPESAPELLNADGTKVGARKNNIDIKTFAFDDCILDRRVRFSLNIANDDANRSVQSWVSEGPDCNDLNNRTSATVPQCWPAMDGNLQTNGVAVSAEFRLQDIAARVKGTRFTRGTAEACRGLNNVPFTLFFMFIRGTQTEGSGATTQLTFDTVGPPPPQGIYTGSGQHQVTVHWDVPTALTELAGYSVFCDDGTLEGEGLLPGTSDTSSTSEEEEPTDDGTTTEDGETPAPRWSPVLQSQSTVLTAGRLPAIQWKPCGTVNTTTTSSMTIRELSDGRTLQNDVPVAFAVSSLDKFGNNGPLSDVIWASPKDTLDFLDSYAAAGGSAKGCASSDHGASQGMLFLAAVFAGAGLYRRSRARRGDEA